MSQIEKLLLRMLSGKSDTTIDFADLCVLLKHLGFEDRIRGSHHIFTKEGVAEIINIHPIGKQAKPYQVKQVRKIILAYQLGEP
jgi:predicted RNA binding protein YcfA (HicA-like mRNA interferase family)